MIQHRKHKLTAAILLTSQLSYAQSIIVIPNLSGSDSGSLLSPVTEPIGQSLQPTINTLDITLDPLTNPIDAQIGAPLIDVASPVITPVLKGLEPIIGPVDGIFHDISEGSLSDALTNSDQNTSDGNGITNDLLGGKKNRNKTKNSETALRTGNPAEGNNGNDKPVGNAQGKKPKNKSPIESVSAPLGRSLTPLIDTVDESLDPITNVIDDEIAEPILSAGAPVIDPLLEGLTPITNPVDGIVSDLSGGSLEDALTTQDYNDEDGQGPINDSLGNGRTQNSGREAGETSPLPIVTRPLGQALDTLVTDLDEGLDPLTDVVDSQLLAPVLDVVAPITEPILAAAEPLTDPVDGSLADLTGGSVEDALTNDDDNRSDGNGVANDLLGGKKNRNKTTNSETGFGTGNPAVGNNGNDKPVGNAQGKKPKNKSPIESVSAPLGRSLTPLIDIVDESLDPITNVIDDEIAEPILSAGAPVIDPLLEGLTPITNPVDGIVSDLSGGSLEDALTTQDYNDEDGQGPINDLLGNGRTQNSGREAGESSPLPIVTRPLGQALDTLVTDLDEGLDPLTDVGDSQLLAPVLDVVAPITEPILAAAEPLTDPVDGSLADLTGGSVEDALTNDDDNTTDGDGLVNDLLGGGGSAPAPQPAPGDSSGSPLAPVTVPLGEALAPVIDAVDTGLDPVTDTVDSEVGVALLDALAPVTEPVVDGAEPIITPVDAIVGELTGGSVSDALSNSDANTADGDGLVNDLLGGGSSAPAPAPSSGSPLAPVTVPLGEALAPVIDAVDTGLDPVTDTVDSEVGVPLLDALAPVTEPVVDGAEPVITPVDAIVNELTGGSVSDALSNSDANTADGDGLVNDLLGGGSSAPAPAPSSGSPLAPVTVPLREALAPVIDAVDTGLDPVTDTVDSEVGVPLLDALAPVTEPVVDGAEPIITPVDAIVSELTGGSVSDALSNSDANTADGDGLVNDLLGGGSNAPAPSSGSPLAAVTVPLGEALAPVIDAVDTGLDPVTDTVDSEVGVPLLDALAPVTEPVVDGAEPVITPVDAIVNELTGGSVSDTLSNSDANTADGDGLVNDLLGGGSSAPAPQPAPGDSSGSPLAPVTVPLREALAPVIDAVDTGLDPVTDTVDSKVGVPLLDALAPVTEPVVDGAEPVITPVDAIVNELTGGSVSDALSNSDANTADGDGLVNDLLGGGSSAPAPQPAPGDSSGSPLAAVTVPLREALAPVIDAVDTGLDPVTDTVDSKVGVPLLDALAPVTEPVVDGAEPVITPVDAIVNELTGGSVSDALSNSDANTADGDGLVNDLLGGGSNAPAPAPSSGSPLAPVTVPLGEALAPVIDAVDTGLDPVTDTVDSEVGVPLLDALAPVTEPVVDGAEPVITPVDAIVNELTGGSVSDALSNSDANTADGDGLVNDLLGGGSNAPAPAPSTGSPLAPVTVPLGEALAPVIDAVDTGLDPVTDTVDSEVGVPLLDALAPVTEPVVDGAEPIITPVDAIVSELTGGSVSDALSNSDANTADGDGLVNDLLGNRNANSANNNPSPNDSDNDGIDDGASGEFNVVARQEQAGFTQNTLNLAITTTAVEEQCVDQDADGVCDQKDRCENTPKASLVLKDGCDLGNIEPARLKSVNFGFDDDTLSPKATATLDEAISLLQRSEYKTIEINGHTDHFGKQDYNLRLSQRRANSVKDYLIEHGIDANRIKINGLGDQSLIAKIEDKDQAELNRRVDFTIIK
ncbi:OmpA family protein [Zhongshania antarctica]|uniref:OmpA family protein n=2 Tax=Zhongshania antarctica TaxID=641702 RepID=UPI0018673FF0|nr:OmpA family protein [Zhongshania antarctica]